MGYLFKKFSEILFRVFVIILFFLLLPGAFGQVRDTIIAEDILGMSLEDMMKMEVVSASKVSQQINEVPANIRVVTAEQIKERGYFTLEQALGDLPGFQFRNINGFNTYSFLRCIPNQNNLILLLVDGIQMNELNSGGFYGGAQYNLTNVERIEVVYGPASSLYGTNAVSGIINIITKKPGEANAGHISSSFGNFDTYAADFGYEYINEEEDAGFRISGMFRTSEKADLSGESGDYNWTDQMENFEDDYTFNAFLKYKSLSAGAIYQNKQSSRTTNYKSVGDEYLDRGTLWNIDFLNAYLKHEYDQGKNWSNNVQVYFRNTTVRDNSIGYIIKADSTQAGDQVGYFRPNYLGGVEEQFNFNLKKSIYFTGGIVYEFESLSENFSLSHSDDQHKTPPPPDQPDQIRNNLLSLYSQAQAHFLNYFVFTAGARQDFSSYYGNVFTPRFALVYNQNEISAKLLYNKAFRAPRPWDFNSGIGNDNLEPEIMKSGELFVSYSIGKYWNIESSVYKNSLSQMLARQIVDTAGNWRWINRDKVNTTGVEFGLHYKKQGFSIFANYAYNMSEDQDGKELPEISRHVVNAGLSANLYRNKLFLHLGGHYYGNRKNPKIIQSKGNNIIDDAWVFNASLSLLDVRSFDLQLIADNVLNAKYYHSSNRPPDRYRQAQRSIRLKLTYNLEF